MITIKEAIDWNLINKMELKYLNPAEQDVIIEIRDIDNSYQLNCREDLWQKK